MKLLFWNLGKNSNVALALECMCSNGGCDKIKVLVDNSVHDIDLYEESRFSAFVFEA